MLVFLRCISSWSIFAALFAFRDVIEEIASGLFSSCDDFFSIPFFAEFVDRVQYWKEIAIGSVLSRPLVEFSSLLVKMKKKN